MGGLRSLRGPLTLAELQDLRADAFADDIEIDFDRMKFWTEEQAIRFFSSGGAAVPHDQPTETDVRANGHSSTSFVRWIAHAWEPLGALSTMLPGEEKGASRGCFRRKPEARARMFCLYGVADVAMSLQPWIDNAPDWLEVRLVDLPGHGFRAGEALSPCASGRKPLDIDALAEERARLVEQLTDEILAAAEQRPFALYGFSFGALMAYGITLELFTRQQADSRSPTPLCLCVAGRCAPHCAGISFAKATEISESDTETMLKIQEAIGFPTSAIPKQMCQRAAELFRHGMLLGAVPSGAGALSSGRLPRFPCGLGDGGRPSHHEPDAPRVVCPLAVVGSDDDGVWPGILVQRWEDLASSQSGFRGLTLQCGVVHMKVMNHERTRDHMFTEVACAMIRKYAQSKV